MNLSRPQAFSPTLPGAADSSSFCLLYLGLGVVPSDKLPSHPGCKLCPKTAPKPDQAKAVRKPTTTSA